MARRSGKAALVKQRRHETIGPELIAVSVCRQGWGDRVGTTGFCAAVSAPEDSIAPRRMSRNAAKAGT